MKLQELYEHYEVIKEAELSRQDMKIDYSLNISVDNGKFKAKGDGSLRLSKDIYQHILSTEDVINYIISQETDNTKIKNISGVSSKDILSQMLFAFMDKDNAKYLSTKDEIQFSFDYGPSESNCIGILITKPFGSPSFSMVMRMDKQALPNEFSKQAIDTRILMYSSVSNTSK